MIYIFLFNVISNVNFLNLSQLFNIYYIFKYIIVDIYIYIYIYIYIDDYIFKNAS